MPTRVRIVTGLLLALIFVSGCGPEKVEPPVKTGDPAVKIEPARKKTEL